MDPDLLLAELEDHGLHEFAVHPLMLALVCILKTGPNKEIPRRAIGLIRRAIDTLTFRWDEAKYIHRESRVALDGDERVRCLMGIAFQMKTIQIPWPKVETVVRRYLDLLQIKSADVNLLMLEIAQWYGLFIPIDLDNWQFVHRTIADYLAARFWVESGKFAKEAPVAVDTRAAYATCLLPDATAQLSKMLKEPEGFRTFCECLYNGVAFDPSVIAQAILDRLGRLAPGNLKSTKQGIEVRLNEDFFSFASAGFLRTLIEYASGQRTNAGDAVSLYTLSELALRGETYIRDRLKGHVGSSYMENPGLRIQAARQNRMSSTASDAHVFGFRK
jgi:hypothetical protein